MKPTQGRSTKLVREVYAIEATTLGLIKIGSADKAERRLRELQVGSPDRLRLRGVVRTDDATRMEANLHCRLAEHRLHGEWFTPAPAVLEAVDALLWSPTDMPFGIMTTAEGIERSMAFSIGGVEIEPGEDVEAFVDRFAAEYERLGFKLAA